MKYSINYKCLNCNKKDQKTREEKFFFLQFNESLNSSFENYFADNDLRCDCGEKMKITGVSYEKVPEKLLIFLKRYKSGDGIIIKIQDPISLEDIEMIDKTDQIENDNNFITKFSIKGSISHSGKGVEAGHYTFWINHKDKYYLISDENVKYSDQENGKTGYVFLFNKIN